ncbi:MAG: hypothetical protein IPQ18_06055 [Saprospiraceae bacterium]|jgi:hypothetical protein|nr:hypothetical protein [Saprospiraceae bacterium]MBL0190909.1 hypothetical protein [Saprospiraceae bacterium]MBL0294263.1 hypothetical protein [Saprospiraceae bacterium]
MKNCLIVFIFMSFGLAAQASHSGYAGVDSLPKVFLIGEHDKGYEKLNLTFDEVLLSVCDNDMSVAYEKWVALLIGMENYADQIKYDIKGVKIWINIFFEKDGTIKHIAYHLKPSSRNIKTEELTAFFSSFMNHYKLPIKANSRFSHYGSASFPTYGKRVTTVRE